MERPDRTRVYLEAGRKRVFACALDWPGWCRSGKDETVALAALGDSASRYGIVVRAAKLRFPGHAGEAFDVVERLTGNATTDFGAPDCVASSDSGPLDAKEAARLARIVGAAWDVLDEVVAEAPAELRKGPRGGGRDRDRVVEHILGAEAHYARKIGVRHRRPDIADAAAIAALREAILDAIKTRATPPDNGWPLPYAARRIAWHVIDHIWEIQDRSEPAGPQSS